MSIQHQFLQDWTHSAWAKAAKDMSTYYAYCTTPLDMSEVCIDPRIFRIFIWPCKYKYMSISCQLNMHVNKIDVYIYINKSTFVYIHTYIYIYIPNVNIYI